MNITQLYPQSKKYPRLRGLYLGDEYLQADDSPRVYANFLSSMDGRIAVIKDQQALLPNELTSQNDLRLFLELQAQADCLITHGGYLRSLAAGRLNNILHIGQSSEHADLADWRRKHSLTPQPLVVICSNSLQFQIPDSLNPKDVWIATSQAGDATKATAWQKQGYKVIEAGVSRVESDRLVEAVKAAGYRRLYLCAGPEIFESCLAKRCLDLCYLTLSLQLIGHAEFLTMLQGNFALHHCHLQLMRLILDQSSQTDPAQLYMTFNCHYQ